jgi:hypothetical protein
MSTTNGNTVAHVLVREINDDSCLQTKDLNVLHLYDCIDLKRDLYDKFSNNY